MSTRPVLLTANEERQEMVYVQRKGQGYRETVDSFETRKEARAMLVEYRLADPNEETTHA